jgi:deoxycytidylate deaminase
MGLLKEENIDMKSKFIQKPHECNRVALTLSPCVDCLKNMAAYGIEYVLYGEKYDKSDFNLVEKIAKLYNITLYDKSLLCK